MNPLFDIHFTYRISVSNSIKVKIMSAEVSGLELHTRVLDSRYEVRFTQLVLVNPKEYLLALHKRNFSCVLKRFSTKFQRFKCLGLVLYISRIDGSIGLKVDALICAMPYQSQTQFYRRKLIAVRCHICVNISPFLMLAQASMVCVFLGQT